MTKETSKNTSSRKKAAPAPKEPALKEHALSYENYMVSQLASIAADLNNVKENLSDLKSDVSDLKKDVTELKSSVKATDAKLETLEKHLPTIWQILGAFALFSGVIITALNVL